MAKRRKEGSSRGVHKQIQENDLLKAIEKKKFFDEFYPKIKAIVKAGGGADNVLKSSEPFAAATIANLLNDEKSEVRLNAAKLIMDRVSGKAVERSMHIGLDVGKLRSEDLDAQIRRLMNQLGPKKFAENILDIKALPKPEGMKQKRKPGVFEVVEEGNDGPQES